MADQRHGTPGHGRLPPYPVGRRRCCMAKSCSRYFDAGRQFSVADLYPDGYS